MINYRSYCGGAHRHSFKMGIRPCLTLNSPAYVFSVANSKTMWNGIQKSYSSVLTWLPDPMGCGIHTALCNKIFSYLFPGKLENCRPKCP